MRFDIKLNITKETSIMQRFSKRNCLLNGWNWSGQKRISIIAYQNK